MFMKNIKMQKQTNVSELQEAVLVLKKLGALQVQWLSWITEWISTGILWECIGSYGNFLLK